VVRLAGRWLPGIVPSETRRCGDAAIRARFGAWHGSAIAAHFRALKMHFCARSRETGAAGATRG
jgi:hypothetical protein